jgi:type I restriction enzyme M protein
LLKQALAVHEVEVPAAVLKGLIHAFGERHPEAEICRVKDKPKGDPEPDTGLRDYENVPLSEAIEDYFEREVKPHVPDAWIDTDRRDPLDGEVGIVGFEIPFNRHFYVFQPPRPLEDIDRDLKACTDRIKQMIEELSA